MNYYNENDPYAAQWLRNLIKIEQLPQGCVDERSIADVKPEDLGGFIQCHFFAGIGGWPLALSLAGWPVEQPVWTGSCPRQPFSVAGKGKGITDERHLWPEFYRLISERQPATVFGEQVAAKAGREWLSGVRLDLEAVGYAVGAADLCAASAGAPHIRQRLFWVADARYGFRRAGNSTRREAREQFLRPRDREEGAAIAGECGRTGGLGDAIGPGLFFQSRHGCDRNESGRLNTQPDGPVTAPGYVNFWGNSGFINCSDGKARRIESGVPPLAHGVPGRVGKLRAYGNAIVPQVAQTFIEAYMSTRP